MFILILLPLLSLVGAYLVAAPRMRRRFRRVQYRTDPTAYAFLAVGILPMLCNLRVAWIGVIAGGAFGYYASKHGILRKKPNALSRPFSGEVTLGARARVDGLSFPPDTVLRFDPLKQVIGGRLIAAQTIQGHPLGVGDFTVDERGAIASFVPSDDVPLRIAGKRMVAAKGQLLDLATPSCTTAEPFTIAGAEVPAGVRVTKHDGQLVVDELETATTIRGHEVPSGARLIFKKRQAVRVELNVERYRDDAPSSFTIERDGSLR